MSFRIYDASYQTRDFLLKINFEEMLVPGAHFGDDANTCHFAVYDHQIRSGPDKRVFFIGTRFFSKYYIVFDQSHLDSGEAFYIQVGIAHKNEDNLAGK